MNALYNAHRAEMDYRISRISSDVLGARSGRSVVSVLSGRRLQRRQAKAAIQTPDRPVTRDDLTRSA